MLCGRRLWELTGAHSCVSSRRARPTDGETGWLLSRVPQRQPHWWLQQTFLFVKGGSIGGSLRSAPVDQRPRCDGMSQKTTSLLKIPRQMLHHSSVFSFQAPDTYFLSTYHRQSRDDVVDRHDAWPPFQHELLQLWAIKSTDIRCSNMQRMSCGYLQQFLVLSTGRIHHANNWTSDPKSIPFSQVSSSSLRSCFSGASAASAVSPHVPPMRGEWGDPKFPPKTHPSSQGPGETGPTTRGSRPRGSFRQLLRCRGWGDGRAVALNILLFAASSWELIGNPVRHWNPNRDALASVHSSVV